MLADNAATPSLHPQSVKVLAAPWHAQLSLRITERLIALLQQHTAAKNTSRKIVPHQQLCHPAGPKESGGKLDAANCQLKCTPPSNTCGVQVCVRVRRAAAKLAVLFNSAALPKAPVERGS